MAGRERTTADSREPRRQRGRQRPAAPALLERQAGHGLPAAAAAAPPPPPARQPRLATDAQCKQQAERRGPVAARTLAPRPALLHLLLGQPEPRRRQGPAQPEDPARPRAERGAAEAAPDAAPREPLRARRARDGRRQQGGEAAQRLDRRVGAAHHPAARRLRRLGARLQPGPGRRAVGRRRARADRRSAAAAAAATAAAASP